MKKQQKRAMVYICYQDYSPFVDEVLRTLAKHYNGDSVGSGCYLPKNQRDLSFDFKQNLKAFNFARAATNKFKGQKKRLLSLERVPYDRKIAVSRKGRVKKGSK